MSDWLHATAVLVDAEGVLIRGPSGSGKSALAWMLIERGGRLIADDRLHLSARAGRLIATAPAATSGLLELRGRGPIPVPHERSAVIRLVADLVPADALPRLPEPGDLVATVLGVNLPRQPLPGPGGHALALLDAALAAVRADVQPLRSA